MSQGPVEITVWICPSLETTCFRSRKACCFGRVENEQTGTFSSRARARNLRPSARRQQKGLSMNMGTRVSRKGWAAGQVELAVAVIHDDGVDLPDQLLRTGDDLRDLPGLRRFLCEPAGLSPHMGGSHTPKALVHVEDPGDGQGVAVLGAHHTDLQQLQLPSAPKGQSLRTVRPRTHSMSSAAMKALMWSRTTDRVWPYSALVRQTGQSVPHMMRWAPKVW